mmetsp:Transcript_9867/g.26613  ORF Transcript_9867/g.26613 Transcript_9867/m.26613 type:complete len:82 (-) Transcript_9867:48-293(-)
MHELPSSIQAAMVDMQVLLRLPHKDVAQGTRKAVRVRTQTQAEAHVRMPLWQVAAWVHKCQLRSNYLPVQGAMARHGAAAY